ncbi:MAG: cupin domain-containing protein [Blastocatellia bacterium]|nr:cupin domain-containing protein [Blastocatellia bacterium]
MNRDIPSKMEEQAALYSLGMLSQTEAQAFDREIADGNEEAAETLRGFESLTAELAFSAPEATPPPELRQRLLASLTPAPTPEEARKQELSSLAYQFFSIRADEGRWIEMAEGVSVKTLFIDAARDAQTTLVRLAPGGRLPRHRHSGPEESLVLEGDCRVNGEVFLPGDYRCAPAGSIDSEVTTEHGTMFLMVSPQEIEVLE